MRVRHRWIALLCIAIASLALSGIAFYTRAEVRSVQAPTPTTDARAPATAKPNTIAPQGFSAEEPVCDVRIYHAETDQCGPFTHTDLDTTILGEWLFDDVGGDCDSMAWTRVDNSGRGNFAALYHGFDVFQQDGCATYLSCLWGFFDNDGVYDYSCGGHPGVPTVPDGAGGLYIDNEIWSPVTPLTGSGTSIVLEFDAYRDLVFDELVFYRWRVRSFIDGEPGEWRSKYWCFYGPGLTTDWVRHVEEIGELVDSGATAIQVALGAVDMYGLWFARGLGDCHSNAPLFDNVRLLRIGTEGPVWNVRQIDLFQDNFANDGSITGFVRADMAKDIAPLTSPTIRPGDSVCVWVDDLQNGLAQDQNTGVGPAVYCYVSVRPPQPAKTGLNLEAPETRGAIKRFPYVGSWVDPIGVTWYQYRMDTVFVDAAFTQPVPDRYCFDLKDNVFTPRDTVFFFFSADNTAATTTTYWTEFAGTTTYPDEVWPCPMEFTCLPANGIDPWVDILYVDAFDGRGAQRHFDWAFQFLGARVDRYDQRGPSSLVNNGLGSRVTGINQQLIGCYRKIIWNSGDLPVGTIGDGLRWPLKTDDFLPLYTFLDLSPNHPGVYFSGDNIGDEWSRLVGTYAIATRTTYMNFTVVSPDHVAFGDPPSPTLQGVAGGIFFHSGGPDTLIAYGGCPKINNFDILAPVGLARAQMINADTTAYYVLSQTTPNAVDDSARVVLSGFSFHSVTWERPYGHVKAHHLRDILNYLQNVFGDIDAVGDEPQARNFLANNLPNPFNPVTTIRYGIREPAHVSLKVYNVAGQLVKTLVDAFQSPEAGGFSVTWDGVDNAGQPVASGVYFYKLVTKGFTQTRKMVLLK
jgi:hypothetical protein